MSHTAARFGPVLAGLALLGATGCSYSGGRVHTPADVALLPIEVGKLAAKIANSSSNPGARAIEEPDPGVFVCPTFMRAARRQPAAPPSPPDAAVVVFVRPSDSKGDIDVVIAEDQPGDDGVPRFLGQSRAASYFEVTLPPGEHRFMAWAYDTAALRATLAPGKKYYVEVALDFGWDPHSRLSAVKPSSKTWKKLPTWLAEGNRLVPDEHRGQDCLSSRPRKTAEQTLRSRAVLAGYDASDLAERTLRSEDGE